MLKSIIFFVLGLAQFSSAHFQVNSPYWRADSFLAPYSQYQYPCAGVNQSVSGNNRTLWPLDGGSVNIEFHHSWTFVFINLGLGSNVTTTFNYTLTNPFWNETGAGTFCLPKLRLPAGLSVTEGQNASLQFVTSGSNGVALYNCADITFSSQATLLSGDRCQNSSGLYVSLIQPETNGSTAASNSSTKPSGASEISSKGSTTYFFVIALAVAISYGLL